MPTMPSHAGSSAGNAPRPIRVEVTGAPVIATSSRRAAAGRRPGIDHPAAGVEEGPLGLGDQSGGLGDGARIGAVGGW